MSTNPQANKKKERACDGCRRRKTKCDGPLMQQNVCTNCIQSHKVCTYVEVSKPRGPPKAYVTGLEERLESLETLLQRICPDTDFSEVLGPPVIRGSWKAHIEPTVTSTSLPSRSQPKDVPTSNPLVSHRRRTTHLTFPRSERSRAIAEAVPTSCAGGYYLSDDSTTDTSSSSSDTEEMLVCTSHGKVKTNLPANEANNTENENLVCYDNATCCTAGLVADLQKLKDMHIRETTNSVPSAPSFPDIPTPAQARRPQYWETPPWESLFQSDSLVLLQKFLSYFPPADLAENLFSLYFARSNSVFPLLHRPTFDRQWHDGLHHRNIWFACVCACLFAVASRWCNDQRVLPEDSKRENGELDWRKAGRQYFELSVEIIRSRKNTPEPACLFEVQTFTLFSMYLRGTNAFPVAWVVVSVGIRKAQDVGAHRKKIYRADPNVDDELWKRAFWHLVVFDRIGGMILGRACGIAEEDFDLDLPLEVDDEYWEGRQDSEKIFEQPRNIPSRIAGFNHFIKLTQIMAFTMRTMYAIDKPKIFCGIIPFGKENLIRQLSSAMEEWLKATPQHLKWRDNMDNHELSTQSAALLVAYYLTLMLIYRPLITMSPPSSTIMPHKPYPSELSPMLLDANPAILICTDAARSCARVVEVQLRDGLNNFYIPSVINIAYVCAGFLSCMIWDLKAQEKAQRSEISRDIKPPIAQRIEDYVADAHIFMSALEQAKLRWDVVDSMLEQLNASLPGAQSQNQNASCSPRSDNASHLGPISEGHPSWPSTYPMDIQSGQAQLLKHNQHFYSHPGTEPWARLRPSPNLPTYLSNTSESRLDSYNSYINHNQPHPVPVSRPRSLTATALPPYIPDEHRTFYTTDALRRTSFSNLNARGSHDGVDPLSLSRPPGFSFSIDESTAKHHDAYMQFDDDQRGYNRLQRKHLPASIGSSMPTDPSVHDIYDPLAGHQNYSHSQSLYHLPYASS